MRSFRHSRPDRESSSSLGMDPRVKHEDDGGGQIE